MVQFPRGFHILLSYRLRTLERNADGSGQSRLTTSRAVDFAPAWSPDGSRIAFSSGRDGESEVHVMNANGSGVTRLTNKLAFDRFPDWSPDGDRIAFGSFRVVVAVCVRHAAGYQIDGAYIVGSRE